MKRILTAAFLTIVAMSQYAKASEFTPEAGEPFCIERDDLQEYMTALLKNDMDWTKRLKGCTVLKGNIRIGVIEDYPSDSELGHVQKIRVLEKGLSIVGYGLRMELEKK